MENIVKYEFEDGTVVNITVKALLDFKNTKAKVKHQKKVIDRLSRKIQRLKSINKKTFNYGTGLFEKFHETNNRLTKSIHKHLEKDKKIDKAIEYCKNCQKTKNNFGVEMVIINANVLEKILRGDNK